VSNDSSHHSNRKAEQDRLVFVAKNTLTQIRPAAAALKLLSGIARARIVSKNSAK
jgi:hypothetical protein